MAAIDRILSLRQRREELTKQIAKMNARGFAHEVTALAKLKKQRLALKDEIAGLLAA